MITVLSVVQKLCGRLAQPVPTDVLGSLDKHIIQFKSLLEEGLEALAARGQWQELTKEQTFVTVALESQGLLTALCAESPSYILPQTLWNRTSRIPLIGTLEPQDWQALKAWQVNGPFYQFRLRENKLLANPIPAAGQTWAFEYVTHNWGESASGAGLRSFSANTDLIRLPEQIVLADLKWRWLEAKGLAYAQAFENAEALVVTAIGRDKPKPIVDMTEHSDTVGPKIVVPVGSWNLP